MMSIIIVIVRMIIIIVGRERSSPLSLSLSPRLKADNERIIKPYVQQTNTLCLFKMKYFFWKAVADS